MHLPTPPFSRCPLIIRAPNIGIEIRINSNWGSANKTCLVRAKIYGIDKSGNKEKLLEE